MHKGNRVMRRSLKPLLLGAFIPLAACGDDAAGPNDGTPGSETAVLSADITSNRTLFADTVYTLRGFVHVANGATLTIQPGTRIEGDFNTLGSALFITRGARIMACGTAQA